MDNIESNQLGRRQFLGFRTWINRIDYSSELDYQWT